MKENKTRTGKSPFETTARTLLQQIKKADRPADEEIRATWNAVAAQLLRNKRRAFVRRLLYYTGTAAAAAVFLFSLYIFPPAEKPATVLSAALLQDSIATSAKTEIVLIAQNRQLELADATELEYKHDGSLTVDRNAVTATVSSRQETPEEAPLNHLIVPKGRRANITFSDGTKLFVNAGSHVIYPAVFGKDKREIAVEGEIYLEVSKDPSRPFFVKAHGFDVKVTGTAFNVCAYKNVGASVVLVEGSVEVKTADDEKVRLRPNQLADIRQGLAEVREVDVSEYICWKDNMMLLTRRPAGEVLERLARYYGRTIEYEPAVSEIPISGKLDLKENLEDVINTVCLSLSLTYETKENAGIYVSSK
ncbi:MAG: FecR domain-containing protein [Parabacteroides sp.]|nr:FecR domain-containing protein [Parabacteroides sp.]